MRTPAMAMRLIIGVSIHKGHVPAPHSITIIIMLSCQSFVFSMIAIIWKRRVVIYGGVAWHGVKAAVNGHKKVLKAIKGNMPQI